jgi:hypothetical protein
MSFMQVCRRPSTGPAVTKTLVHRLYPNLLIVHLFSKTPIGLPTPLAQADLRAIKKPSLLLLGKEGACFADWLTPLPASRDQIKGILFMFQL